jgi:hypothetical protein
MFAATNETESVPPPALADKVTVPAAVGDTVLEIVPVASAVNVHEDPEHEPSVAPVAEALTLTPAAGAPVSPSKTCTLNEAAAVRAT